MSSKKKKRLIKTIIFIILILSSLVLISRYIETKGLVVNEIPIKDKLIPKNFHGIKIVQISDIHYMQTTDIDDIKKIVDEINTLKPDIVLFTGDILDKDIKYKEKDLNNLTEELKNIEVNIEKYYVKGDHDLNFDNIDMIYSNSDFKSLNDTYKLIYYNDSDPILLVGISSNYKKNHIKEDIKNILSSIDKKYKYSILLLHEPDFIDEIDYKKFNLILAGHSLNGQINIPFIKNLFLQDYSKKYYKNYYLLDKTKLYISSGIGTTKIKFRFLNKPSINFFRLQSK